VDTSVNIFYKLRLYFGAQEECWALELQNYHVETYSGFYYNLPHYQSSSSCNAPLAINTPMWSKQTTRIWCAWHANDMTYGCVLQL